MKKEDGRKKKKLWVAIVVAVFILFFTLILINSIISKIHKEERKKLFSELIVAESIDECKSISEQIIKVGPQCSGYVCVNSGEFYRDYVPGCISSIAVRQNNQDLCSDEKTNEEIDRRWGELVGFPSDKLEEFLSEGINLVEETCLLAFISKAQRDTTINIDCNLFESDSKKDECFGFLATAKLNPKICLNISSNYSQGQCMNYFAFRNNDISLCDYGTDWQINACKEALNILRNNNSMICEKIDSFYDSSSKEECYLGFAIFNKDSSLCPEYADGEYFLETAGTCERYTR